MSFYCSPTASPVIPLLRIVKPAVRTIHFSRWQSNVAKSKSSKPSGFLERDLSSLIDRGVRNTKANPWRTAWCLNISQEVRDALKSKRPVVALESTIYTHGFPYPNNVSLALDLEKIVRDHGATPATIGVIDGEARVGLTEQEITNLASAAGDPQTMKVSRRDLPFILGMGIAGKKLNGGTTIAATMLLAHRAGISIFGTGGLGGVHRGAESTMDVSADLTELGRTPVAVISSGCKSFLDIPRTLEYLETQGVTVCTFADGRTGKIEFPAFYTRESGSLSPLVVQNAKEAASIIRAQETLLIAADRAGLLFANPIPVEHSMPKSEIDNAIEQAVREAAEQGFHGHSNTPFILNKIKELTKGNSIPANRALIESNVAMAAQVAVELTALRNSYFPIAKTYKVSAPVDAGVKIKVAPATPDVIVIGSVAVDLSCDYTPEKIESKTTPSGDTAPKMHTSNIAAISPSIGGVGYNVARAAKLAGPGISVSLRSFVGKDLAGTSILQEVENNGLDASKIIQLESGSRTAQYIAVNDANKDLVLAMADMSIFSDSQRNPSTMCQKLLDRPLTRDTWVVVDANWSPSILKGLLSNPDSNTRFIYEPVSVPKSGRIFEPADDWNPDFKLGVFPNHHIYLSTPNQHELAAMHESAKKTGHFESDEHWRVIDALGIPSSGARDRFVSITNAKLTDEGIPQQTIQLLPYIPTILTKLGAEGVLLTELLKPNDRRLTDPSTAPYILSRNSNGSDEIGGVYMRLFPPAERVNVGDVVSVNGVGDTFLGVLVAGLASGEQFGKTLINTAQRGAVMTLRSKESVSPDVSSLRADAQSLVRK